MTAKWSDVRQKHIDRIGAEQVEQGKSRLLAEVRAHRLADLRRRHHLTQREVASAMDITVGRVSQIESGELSGIDVLDRYITALGGRLELIATFGDEHIKVG